MKNYRIRVETKANGDVTYWPQVRKNFIKWASIYDCSHGKKATPKDLFASNSSATGYATEKEAREIIEMFKLKAQNLEKNFTYIYVD